MPLPPNENTYYFLNRTSFTHTFLCNSLCLIYYGFVLTTRRNLSFWLKKNLRKYKINKKNSKSGGTDDAGYGNATNAEENNSQNQCGILFPVQEEVSATEADLIARIKTTGKEKKSEK